MKKFLNSRQRTETENRKHWRHGFQDSKFSQCNYELSGVVVIVFVIVVCLWATFQKVDATYFADKIICVPRRCKSDFTQY